MKELESLMAWAIGSLKQSPEDRGDWQAKVHQARSSRLRQLKTVTGQIRACRKINIDCPELETLATKHIEALDRIDDIEKRFKTAMN